MIVAVVIGLVAGGLGGWALGVWRGQRAAVRLQSAHELEAREWIATRERLLAAQERLAGLGRELDDARRDAQAFQREVLSARERLADSDARRAEAEARHADELRLLDDARQKLTDAFAALAGEALHKNNTQFLELARTSLERFQQTAQSDLEGRKSAIEGLVKPLVETLGRFDTSVRDLEKAQGRAQGSLHAQLTTLTQLQAQLQRETHTLAQALKSSSVRGRWGEVQLRRVVELAGMLEHCDFFEQVSDAHEGGRQRPDMLVRLPGDKLVVVDAKAPCAAFIAALEATSDVERSAHLAEHGQAVRRHMQALGGKEYYRGLPCSPEFVIMFLPGEAFLSAALEADPSLIEFGPEHGVLPATPITLIALLKAIAFGWRQEQIAQNAQKISEVGRTLHERLAVFAGHFATLRRGIEGAVGAYNQAVGSLESRVLVAAEQLAALGAASPREVPAPERAKESLRHMMALPAEVPGQGRKPAHPEPSTGTLPGLEVVRSAKGS